MSHIGSIFLAAAAALSLVACSGSTDGAGDIPEETLSLLHTVPSDALAVSVRRSCSDAVALLDSASALRSLDYGRFDGARSVLSWCYDGDLSPVLAFDTGKSQAGADEAERIMHDADSLGLHSRWYEPDSRTGRRSVLVLTPSEALLTAVGRHVSEGRSIMDAAGFGTATAAAENSGNFTVLRNSGALRLLPRRLLDGIYPQRSAAGFLRTVSDWVTICPAGGDSHRIILTCGEEPSYFSNMFPPLPFGDSRLGDILPADTEFAVSLPVPQPEFREAYEKYVDASVRYTQYVRRIASLEKLTGKSPLDWELETGVREVALIAWNGAKVAAVRPAKAPEDAAPTENQWRGFIPALYGSAFSLPDDSVCATVSGWLVYGSREDVDGFLESQARIVETEWPRRGVHIVMYKSGTFVCWNKKGISLWNSVQ